ncbi:MAG: ribokinase [Deltaproteobacteria bacterium]|nr:ribokinase [Deltaproteobacteria bacterium]
MSIVVFGSINMDLVVRTPYLPAPGETLIGRSFETFPGGKGANQAVGCAKLGAKTLMVGQVGSDEFASKLLASLNESGVDTRYVEKNTQTSSGVALIAVDDTAENNIIVVPGANGKVAESDLDRLAKALDSAEILLLQLEIPMPVVVAAARLAQRMGVRVILDPAPAVHLPDNLLASVDILTPNETETSILVNRKLFTEEDYFQAGHALRSVGVKNVIIKLGEKGALLITEKDTTHFESFKVKAVDTVAAGDAFNAALAAGLSTGMPLEKAIQWGMAGGAVSVTRPGAQPSMADKTELLAMLNSNQIG